VKTVGLGRDFWRSSGHLRPFSNGKSRSFRENPQTRFFGRIAGLPGVGFVRLYAIFSSRNLRFLPGNGRKFFEKFGGAICAKIIVTREGTTV